MPFVNAIRALRRGSVRILKHHRTSDVYIDGRYLHVTMKISLKSKRGREIARETALTVLQAIEEAEDTVTVAEANELSDGRAPSSNVERSS